MTTPDIDSISTYNGAVGGILIDYTQTEDPNTDQPGLAASQQQASTAMMTVTAPRAYVAFTYNGASAATTIAAGSNNVALPIGTINVASTTGFPSIGIAAVTTTAGVQGVSYTGLSGGNQLTGCTGGTGTMNTGNAVATAVTVTEHQAMWGNAAAVAPVVVRTSAGFFAVNWPAIVADVIGTNHNVNMRRGWCNEEVYSANTLTAAGSNGQSLPFATINVASTTGFPVPGVLSILTTTGVQTVAYTGTSGGNQFTGCTGGTGNMATNNLVSGPALSAYASRSSANVFNALIFNSQAMATDPIGITIEVFAL